MQEAIGEAHGSTTLVEDVGGHQKWRGCQRVSEMAGCRRREIRGDLGRSLNLMSQFDEVDDGGAKKLDPQLKIVDGDDVDVDD